MGRKIKFETFIFLVVLFTGFELIGYGVMLAIFSDVVSHFIFNTQLKGTWSRGIIGFIIALLFIFFGRLLRKRLCSKYKEYSE